MTAEPNEVAARLRADQARERLAGTLALLQDRLKPGAIAQNAWESAVDRGTEAAEEAAAFVRKRPAVSAAAASALVALVAGAPLLRRWRRKPDPLHPAPPRLPPPHPHQE